MHQSKEIIHEAVSRDLTSHEQIMQSIRQRNEDEIIRLCKEEFENLKAFEKAYIQTGDIKLYLNLLDKFKKSIGNVFKLGTKINKIFSHNYKDEQNLFKDKALENENMWNWYVNLREKIVKEEKIWQEEQSLNSMIDTTPERDKVHCMGAANPILQEVQKMNRNQAISIVMPIPKIPISFIDSIESLSPRKGTPSPRDDLFSPRTTTGRVTPRTELNSPRNFMLIRSSLEEVVEGANSKNSKAACAVIEEKIDLVDKVLKKDMLSSTSSAPNSPREVGVAKTHSLRNMLRGSTSGRGY